MKKKNAIGAGINSPPLHIRQIVGISSALAFFGLLNFALGSELSRPLDSMQSPDGRNILQRIWVNGDTEPDVDVDYVELAIHDHEHKATGDDVFLSQ